MGTRRSRAKNLALGLGLGLATLGGCNSILGNEVPEADGIGGAGGSSIGHGAQGGAPEGSGGDSSGGGLAGSDTGGGGSGGDGSTTVGTVGEPCSQSGALGCSGYAKKGQVLCEGGEWKANGTCNGSNNCDTSEASAGSCQPILTDCEDAAAGDATTECAAGVPQVCGVDLTRLEDGTPCASDHACVDGECLPLLSECLGKSAGETVCSEDASETFECGPNLITKESRQECRAGMSCFGAECVPVSCADLPDTCGRFADDDCCRSLLVDGGPFDRGEGSSNPASISDFRLDKYEVTVGRFRKFVDAWDGGWRPGAGAGRHEHLNDGLGLNTTTDSVEGGWETQWAESVDTSDSAREAGGDPLTWTAEAGDSETLPITSVSWYEAYAFAIWDGGFLPSEAEWEYAAAGGSLEQFFPWGTPQPDCSYANFYDADGTNDYCVGHAAPVGTYSPKGDGLWGQSDLSGNLLEWVLDFYDSTYSASCNDCTNATPAADRGVRGGHWEAYPGELTPTYRYSYAPTTRAFKVGFRVARSP